MPAQYTPDASPAAPVSARKTTVRAVLIAAGLVWMIAIGFGLSVLWSFENAPGVAAAAPGRWPSASRIPAPHSRATLVMLAHPQCACSRASVAELARLMAHAQGAVDAYVLFLAPTDQAEDWVTSDLWRAAAAIPGVRVLRDEDGREARGFGAATSGQTLLYDGAGSLQFSGGITGSRGHEGDNQGRLALASLLANGGVDRTSTSVFGCALFSASDEAGARGKAIE